MATRVLVADDHKIVSRGLRSLLEKQPDMEVVGEAPDGRAVIKLVEKSAPDIIIMDIQMPDLNGVEATRRVKEISPRTRIIALSMHKESRFVNEMFKAGADGYLLKECAFEEMPLAIRTVLSGKRYISPEVAGVVIDAYVSGQPASESQSILTAKEREVLQLLAEGYTTKQIAGRLYVSVKTVETHRQHIMAKLKLHSVAELTKYAIREGLTSQDI